MTVLGVDIGGTNIKAALVDIESGQLCSERYEVETTDPQPDSVIQAVSAIVEHFGYRGPLGVGIPCVVLDGKPRTPFAAYQIKAWVDYPISERIQEITHCPTLLLNDADAAGIAEVKFGSGQGQDGVIIVLTIGTGIGSAVFIDGILVPNTEFGHLFLRDQPDVVENQASERARRLNGLSLTEWSMQLNALLDHLYRLFSPKLLVLGGGVAERTDLQPLIAAPCLVQLAKLGNSAGIVGTAMGAHSYFIAKNGTVR